MATTIELGGNEYTIRADKHAALNLDTARRAHDEGGDVTRFAIVLWSMMGETPPMPWRKVAGLLLDEEPDAIKAIADAAVAEQQESNSKAAKKKRGSGRSAELKSA